MTNPPPMPSTAASSPPKAPTAIGHQHADVEARFGKAHLEWPAMHPEMLVQAARRPAGWRLRNMAPKLSTSIRAPIVPEKQDVGEADEQIDLAQRHEQAEQGHARNRADDAAGHQDPAHLQVDRPPSQVGQHAGHGRCQDLRRLRSHGHRRRHAHEDQHRRHQEPAADPEQAGQEADHAPEAEHPEQVHGHLGHGKVDVHAAVGPARCVPSSPSCRAGVSQAAAKACRSVCRRNCGLTLLRRSN